jgi:hypothetical protein
MIRSRAQTRLHAATMGSTRMPFREPAMGPRPPIARRHLGRTVRHRCVLIAAALALAVRLAGAEAAGDADNALLIPKVVPDREVVMEGASPDWVKTLIMAQFRIETATPEGTFAAASRVLDHYAAMGVNGLWINPIQERGSRGNGYGNYGPDTIEPLLTGARDRTGSLAAVRTFVSEAHRRNIRVLFDIVVWGTSTGSPLVASHPEFYRRDGAGLGKAWGGYAFDWENPALRAWFKVAAVDFILQTGADGFRVDLAPDTSGYFFQEVRAALYAQGRKIIVVSERPNERRDTFDFEQTGVSGWLEEPDFATPGRFDEQRQRFGQPHDYLFAHDLVDAIRSGRGIGKPAPQQQGGDGRFRFYTANLLCHDDAEPFVKGDRIRFAYATLFAPFIPLWWIGEEWDNPKALEGGTGVMYFNHIDWARRDSGSGAAFFADVKRLIRVRRSYPGIFERFAADAREANIARIASRVNGAQNPLQAYARIGVQQAVLIVPNTLEATARAEVSIDLHALLPGAATACTITDLLGGRRLPGADDGALTTFTSDLPGRHLGIYLVETVASH